MTSRKHNEFLDIEASEDEVNDRGYDSEENVAKTKGRAVKRRRTADGQDLFGLKSDEEDSADEAESEEEKSRTEVKGKTRKQTKGRLELASEDEDEFSEEEIGQDGALLEIDDDKSASKSKTKSKPLTLKALKPPKKPKKTGIIYLSSLPPYLKPFSLKSLIEKRGFGPITKVFLSPLVPSNSGARKRSNKRQLYTDGWIELPKKVAKICAEALNANIVGGRKGGWYHDDVWNMKYLRGFKWEDLMEQVQRERSEREARQRVEDARAKKEEKIFLAGVEAGRVADGMARKNEEKRKRKLEAAGGDEDVVERKAPAVRRRFVQNNVVGSDRSQGKLGDDAKRVLGKIF
ncbi:hypothetical protein N7495_006391 [Penicillium taxi]|uniref:uncharacterized protein n=1 Tax=Penicillium taxi TaxID=168475 RepID=UPI002544F1A7|nr:uncharacterized protein N7495_006391 [Penicillium taxi]KAJ5894700.1 hypothetical protein N7495_006391 [Penicillium taxi]